MKEKIVLLTPFLSKSRGGIENLSYNLYQKLRKFYKIFCFSGNVENNIKNVYYSKYKSNKILIGIDLLGKALKIFNRYNIDLSIALTWKMGIISFINKKIFGVPYFLFIHGNDIYPNNKNTIEKKIIKIILKNSTLIIANSNYTKRLCKNYGRYNIRVINPGINFKNNIRIKYNNESKKKKVLFSLCRLEKRKGIDTVLKSLPKVISKYPNIHYYIGGKGSYKEELVKIVKDNNLEDYVTFLGFLEEYRKDTFLKLCDCFIMPSYEIKEKGSVEGFGIVYLEANMYGKFVIAGQSGGITDAVIDKKTGLCIDGRNPDKVYEAIADFYDNYYNKEKYKRYCVQWAKEHDWSKVVKVIKNLIDSKIS